MLAWDRPLEPALHSWFGPQDTQGPGERLPLPPERRPRSTPDSYSGPKLLQTTARFHIGGSNNRGANYGSAWRPRQVPSDQKALSRPGSSRRTRDAPPLLSLHSADRPRHTGRTGERTVVSTLDPAATDEWGTKRANGFAPSERTLFAGSGVSQRRILPDWVAHCRQLESGTSGSWQWASAARSSSGSGTGWPF